MPEFRHRVDTHQWQTPAFEDIFPEDDATADNERVSKESRRQIEAIFAEQNLAIALSASRTMPSYNYYRAKLKSPLPTEELENLLYEVESDKGWIVGINPRDKRHFELLLRTLQHQSLHWKHVITQIRFRQAQSPASFVMGVNLHQQTVLQDWDSMKHLLILGSGGPKQSIIRNLLLTGLMLHTPSEFRFAIIGRHSEDYRYLRDMPHLLGKPTNPNAEVGIRLIFGMQRELERRREIFRRYDATSFADCNYTLVNDAHAPLPRVVLVLDTLNDSAWIKHHTRWVPYVKHLLADGAKFGIHLMMTVQNLTLSYPFDELSTQFSHKMIARSIVTDAPFIEKINDFHSSLLRFVDSFYEDDTEIYPIELPAVTAADIRALVNYWQNNKSERSDLITINPIDSLAEDGIGEIYKSLTTETNRPLPPIPEKPTSEQLARAAEILADADLSNNTQETPESNKLIADAQALDITVEMVQKAQALATYLGWLGKGPLADVLDLSYEQADAIIAILQARQILERGNTPTPRLHFSLRK